MSKIRVTAWLRPPSQCVIARPFLGACTQRGRETVCELSGVSVYEDTNTTLRTSFYLNYFFSGPMSKYSHTGAVGGVGLGLQHMNLEGNKNIKSIRVGTMGFLQLPSRFFLSLGFGNLNMICLGIVSLFVCLFSLLGGL